MAEDCLFCKIAAGEIPSDEVYSDEDFYAFRDIQPAAPTHVLIVPRKHIATIADGKNIKNYFDGKLVGTGGATTSSYGSSIYNVHIGGGGVYDATGNFFSGQFDEVAIFDKAIPAARIAEHFKAGKEGGVITTSGAVTPIPSATITLSVTQSANTLTISWEGSGTLQSAPSLAGATTTWTDVGTANPATVTIGTGNSFYRVKQ